MNIVTAEEIQEIDSAIDAVIPSQPLLSRNRDVALIHLLRHYEMYQYQCASIRNPGEREIVNKHGYEGMHHAVKWIFQFCLANYSRPNLSYDEYAYQEAAELHKAARDYSKVWDLMSMLQRGLLIGFREKDRVLSISFASTLDKEMDIAGDLIAGPDDPDVQVSEPIVTPFIKDLILHNVKARTDSHQALKYNIPNIVFDQVSDRIDRLTAGRWVMDSSWDLGGYTIGQLRQFWTALNTLCLIHELVCFSLKDHQRILELVVRFLNRKAWEKELSIRSKLRQEVVSQIISDLIYDPGLYEPGSKQAHVTFQPIFSFGCDILAVSNWLVHTSNIERNTWDLVSIKRPPLHSKLRNFKEKNWVEELQNKSESFGVKVYPPIEFKLNGRKSDLDVLILDQKLGFGLVCQLKWLMAPGRISNTIYNDKEIEKGIEQARLALDWVKSYPTRLSQHTGLSLEELRQYEFRPIVICKSCLASGWLRQPGIPVINERLFDWILGDPHRKSLKTLWYVAEELRYLPKIGKHFEDICKSVEFGGICFKGEPIGYILKEVWNPAEDINLEGLS